MCYDIYQLGKIVREQRSNKCLSRDKVSNECNKAAKTVENVEKGKDPRLSTIMAVASALDMNLGDLNPCIGKEAPKKEDTEKSTPYRSS